MSPKVTPERRWRWMIAAAACVAAPVAWSQTFTDVTAAAGITGGGGSWAGVWGDYDNDGLLDLFTIGHLQPLTGGKNQLWRATSLGLFTDWTVNATILSDKIDTHGAVWADFDRDGDLDLMLLNETITDKPQLYNEFWRNNGNGTFTEIGAAAGILGYDHITRGLATADFNRDGLLDVFGVVQDLHKNPNTPPAYSPNNLLWRNDGNLTFTDVGVAAGVAMPKAGGKRTATFADYDNDGWPDLMVMPDCSLFRNNTDGSFTEVTEAAGILRTDQCQGAGWADYDNDGDLDVYISRGFDVPFASALYRNNGDGTFTDVTAASGIANKETGRAVTWGDYDNDGLIDLYVVNYNNPLAPNRLFRNNGDGTFSDVTAAAGVGAQVAGGGAHGGFVDVDDDGDLDLFITNGEANTIGPYVLLRNNGNGNAWLKVRLKGVASNTDAIGTRLKLTTSTATRYGHHSGPAHWMSQSSLPVHFGMGTETTATSLQLAWPSGAVQTIENIGARQTVTVEEGVAIYVGPATVTGPGFFVSRNGTRWRVEWKGENSSSRFLGRIMIGGTFSNVVSIGFEPNDKLTVQPNLITFNSTEDGKSTEAIEFDASGAQLTFDLKQDTLAQPTKVAIGKYGVRPGTLPLRFRQ